MGQHSFTPGPWSINQAGHGGPDGKLVVDEVFVYAPDCGVDDIAVAADIVDPLTGKPSPANARLIAAAPLMLEALQAFNAKEQDIVSGSADHLVLRVPMDVIAKMAAAVAAATEAS